MRVLFYLQSSTAAAKTVLPPLATLVATVAMATAPSLFLLLRVQRGKEVIDIVQDWKLEEKGKHAHQNLCVG